LVQLSSGRGFLVVASCLPIICALAFLSATPADAQYSRFGKNKIQYDDFNWEILTGEHVDLYYYPQERELALIALDYAEESFAFLERKFSYSPKDRIPLVVYASHQHFEQTNIVPFFIPEGVAGFTEFLKGRVALPFNGSYSDFRRVIRHELVHVFQARKGAHYKRLHPGGNEWRSPFWFIEGLAEYWSGPWTPEGDLVVRDLLLNGRVPSVSGLDRFAGSFAAYKLGQNLMEFLGQEFGEERLVELMESEWKYPNFSTSFRKVYGLRLNELTEIWHRHLRQQYFPTLAVEKPAATTAIPVVTKGRLNFTPAVVPESIRTEKHGLAYVTIQSGYTSINTADLFGENHHVDTKITGGRSGDLETVHPLLSLLDISDRGQLAFVAKSGARDAVYVHELESGKRKLKGQWKHLVVIVSPTWAPDGRRLAFVGQMADGYSDLYVWDTATDQLERLTQDRYLDSTPSWSPTGDVIAFASDRTPFGSEGARNLYLIDVATSEIQPLTFGRWVDRDPDWSPDGQQLVFSSDRAGTLDVHVVDREGNGRRVTALTAGAMHPRWYREDGQDGAVFTSYEDIAYGIYRVPIVKNAPASFSLAIDGEATEWEWEKSMAEPEEYVQREYDRKFGLDFATAALAFSEDGGRGEGATVFFSDMLGDHLVAALVNSQSGRTNLFSGFTGALTYVNLKRRFNWGVTAYRLRSFFDSLLGQEFERGGFDEPGIGVRNDFFEQRWGVSGIAMYPMSKFQRLELGLGFERNDLTELPAGPEEFDDPFFFRDAWLLTGLIGYVFDNSLWGPVGPVDGQRINVTVAPIFNLSEGQLETANVLVDARKYLRTSVNTTLAVRGRARYSSGDIPTFYFLGGPLSMRGYPTSVLNGSRTLLINQEWRFPLLRPNRFRSGMGTLLSQGIWGGVFVDLGNAWSDGEVVRNKDGKIEDLGWPGLLGSYGASVRYPLFGAFILRVDWARRFDIDEKRNLFPNEDDDNHFSFFIGYNY